MWYKINPAYWFKNPLEKELYQIEKSGLNSDYKKLRALETRIQYEDDVSIVIELLDLRKNLGIITEEQWIDERVALEVPSDVSDPLEKNYLVAKVKKGLGVMTEYEFRITEAEFNFKDDPVELEKEKIHIKYEEGLYGDDEDDYDRDIHTASGLSYLKVINVNIDENNPAQSTWEFAWNDIFINELRANGYVGNTPDELVEEWFATICRANYAEYFNKENGYNLVSGDF